MKKFLSLVLALVMAMSLVTISAGATAYKDLTDKGSVTYTEAVQLMNGLGIISGYTDGSFKPTATLTRGAAAKIIAYLNLGTSAADALTCDASPYKDVKTTDTFAPYIAYCKNAKLIDGYADGTFKAGNSLTGFQFAKMLLTSLGYKSDVEAFTGSNWSVNVAKIAVNAGLFKGNSSFVGTKVVTREEACLYAFNTLFADEVQYLTSGTTIVTGDGTKIVTGGASATKITNATDYRMDAGKADTIQQFCEDHFSTLRLYTGKVSSTRATAATTTDSITYNTNSKNSATGTLTVYKADLGLGLYGHSINLYTNDQTSEAKQVVYAAVDKASKAVTFTATSKTTDYELLAKTAGFSVANSSYLTAGYTSLVNYAAGTIGAVATGANYVMISNNDNQTVDLIIKVSQTADVVTKVTTSTSSTTGVTTTVYTFESGLVITNKSDAPAKLVTSDTLAKDDVVMLTSIGGSTYSAAKCTSITGTFSGKNTANSGDPTYIFDGTIYGAYKSGDASVAIAGGVASVGYAAGMTLNTSYTAYLDSTGKIVAVKGASSTTNYVYVAKTALISSTDSNGITSSTLSAVVYASDGTSKVYKVDTDIGGNIVADATGLYNMTVGSNGKASFTATSGKLSDAVVTTDLAKYSNQTGVSKLAESSAAADVYTNAGSVVYFVNSTYGKSDFSVTAVVGMANMPNITAFASMVAGLETSTGTTTVMKAAVVNGSYSGSIAANTVFYNGKYSVVSTNDNGTASYAVTYTVYKDGVEQAVTYNMNSTTFADLRTAAGFYTTGDKNLAVYSGSGISTSLTTTSLYNGYLATSSGDYQVSDAAVVDLTPDTQTFTSLVETGKTVTAYIAYTTNTNGVKVASQVYVLSVVANDYTVGLVASGSAVHGVYTTGVTTANYNDTVTITLAGTAADAGTYTLKYNDGTDHTIGSVVLAAAAVPAGTTLSFVMPASNVTLSLTYSA